MQQLPVKSVPTRRRASSSASSQRKLPGRLVGIVSQGVRIVQKKSSMNIRDRAAYYNGKAAGGGIGLDTQVNAQTKSRMLGR